MYTTTIAIAMIAASAEASWGRNRNNGSSGGFSGGSGGFGSLGNFSGFGGSGGSGGQHGGYSSPAARGAPKAPVAPVASSSNQQLATPHSPTGYSEDSRVSVWGDDNADGVGDDDISDLEDLPFGQDDQNSSSYGSHGGYGNPSTEAYGVDNQYYGHQNTAQGHDSADNHNSNRQSGHQGQGHNQWADNAWNQWGVNNHYDTQKAVDNKWGNNSGKINLTLNSVSGHYDNDYGQQQRGVGYEGHQNTSGEVGYQLGMGGHSFGYEAGDHSYGYENNKDYGYGGWANNLGAYNHGANYDNFGNQYHEDRDHTANNGRDTSGIKENRRVGQGYADLEELDQFDARQDQYDRVRVGNTGAFHGIGRHGGVFSADEFNEFGGAGANSGSSYGSGPSKGGRSSYGSGLSYGSGSRLGSGSTGQFSSYGVIVDGTEPESYGRYANVQQLDRDEHTPKAYTANVRGPFSGGSYGRGGSGAGNPTTLSRGSGSSTGNARIGRSTGSRNGAGGYGRQSQGGSPGYGIAVYDWPQTRSSRSQPTYSKHTSRGGYYTPPKHTSRDPYNAPRQSERTGNYSTLRSW